MRIAIDTGGTFTDCLFLRRGRLEVLKVFSTPDNPARAIAQALAEVQPGADGGAWELLHGTTVGTNALLERRGGRVLLLTTAGFEDVLEIGRQARPRLYDLFVTRPPALVPARRRLGVAERVGARGEVLRPLVPAELRRLVRRVERIRPQAVAVCLLFSFVNPAHERRLLRALEPLSRRLGIPLTASHEILPEFREYERTSTVAANAYLMPVLGRYLWEVEKIVGPPTPTGLRRVKVMQSSGGTISARVAAQQPVRTILSGPAGGVIGAGYAARLAGLPRAISFDMGGTSTDVALIAGEFPLTTEGTVGEIPIAVPMLDIHSVGAGGGSIAWFDRGGALRVGPQSAGADPGPICYGRGREPTVTDAHLILGRLDPERFLGGAWKLDPRRTRAFLERAIRGRRLGGVPSFAAGILAVANATMERAIRVISMERGHDPRQFALVAFGGAGGLHAASLAVALGIPQVLVPRFPGALSALGLLRSDGVKDYSRTVLWPLEVGTSQARELERRLRREFAHLARSAHAELGREGFPPARQRLLPQLDLRYQGQAYELILPHPPGQGLPELARSFHRAHEQRYGYADPARPIEVVNLRLRAWGITDKPALRAERARRNPAPAASYRRARVWFEGGWRQTRFYIREELRAGQRLAGPAVVAEYSATTVVPPGWRLRVDGYGNLLLGRQ